VRSHRTERPVQLEGVVLAREAQRGAGIRQVEAVEVREEQQAPVRLRQVVDDGSP
jgi:hypothetical protein